MTRFTAEWLALREPADAAARSKRLVREVADRLPRGRPVRAIDLASGTGANVRYLAPRLVLPQRWLLVDRDAELLARVPACVPGSDVRLETRRVDLSAEIASSDPHDLITASALLDLVSESWLERVADWCADAGAAVLFALTYDGRIECDPPEPEDEDIRALVNAHQRTDKGFGAALGPAAIDTAQRAFLRRDYRVDRERADWRLASESRSLQRQLVAGWTSAATELEPARADAIRSWGARRLAHVDAGQSRLTIGHEDLAAWPRTPRAGHPALR